MSVGRGGHAHRMGGRWETGRAARSPLQKGFSGGGGGLLKNSHLEGVGLFGRVDLHEHGISRETRES